MLEDTSFGIQQNVVCDQETIGCLHNRNSRIGSEKNKYVEPIIFQGFRRSGSSSEENDWLGISQNQLEWEKLRLTFVCQMLKVSPVMVAK